MSNSITVGPSDVAAGDGRSLRVAVLATTSVVVIPTFVAFALLVFSQPRPYLLAAVIASALLTTGAAIAGAALWARQPESAGVSFGDLMLWSWVRHRHAERTLAEATQALGLDGSGRPRGEPTAGDGDRLEALLAIARALDSKSSYTLGHSRRVERHARRMGERLELEPTAIQELSLAASLHDVGNIALSDAITRKPGEPTLAERSAIEAHVLLGASIVDRAGSAAVIEGIRHHHEHWNGEGYPDRLNGLQIPLFARIISIAEAYDAMTSARPYRQGFGTRDAVAILRSEAGSQFDPDLVEIFISTLRKPFSLVERAPFLAGLQRQIREVWLVFRRIGAVALSATASTIAIALILGSTVLTPGTPPDEVQDLANQQGSRPLDRVLGSGVVAAEETVDVAESGAPDNALDASFDDGASVGSSDPEGPTSGTIGGGAITFDPDGPSGGGTDPDPEPDGGGGTDPGPDGGGTDPDPEPDGGGTAPEPDDGGTDPDPDGGGGTDPEPDDGGTDPNPDDGGTDPDPDGGEQPPPADSKDKNPDANGNGNANGHDKDKGKP